jgi:hypothetical protein
VLLYCQAFIVDAIFLFLLNVAICGVLPMELMRPACAVLVIL